MRNTSGTSAGPRHAPRLICRGVPEWNRDLHKAHDVNMRSDGQMPASNRVFALSTAFVDKSVDQVQRSIMRAHDCAPVLGLVKL